MSACARVRVRARHPHGWHVLDVSVGKCELLLVTLKSAAMSVKADVPAAEEEENSELYYSDEDDDLGAFSDAELGCEDEGRATVEGQKARQRRKACVVQKRRLWLQRSYMEKRALAGLEGTPESTHFEPILLYVRDQASVLGRRQTCHMLGRIGHSFNGLYPFR